MCITFGLTHNGKDAEGRIKWDGCANVKLRTFETATQMHHYILSFNTNTNHWCAEYIYKRVKFLGSKIYSQIITLLFLALWHGLHSGYYHCFFMEFVVTYFERDVSISRLACVAHKHRKNMQIILSFVFSIPILHFLLFSRSDQY